LMNWPDEIADELPAPRDDEPSSLRQDIADELADHLHSSFVRELHRTPEETSAREHVLDRFGDPRRVARKLWFDAMKEKIMSQRVNLALSSLMTVACLGALGLMTLMLRDSREVNTAILERLQALVIPQPAPQPVPVQPAVDTSRSMDWVPAKFKLVLDTEGSPPAVGFKVHMQSAGKDALLGETVINGTVVSGQLEMTTGPDGIADLGLCRFGSYLLTVSSPWGERLSRQFSLRPSQENVREIKCPAAAPEQVDVTFSVDWPDDLKDQELWLACSFNAGNRRIGPESWSMGVPGYTSYPSYNSLSMRDMLIINSHGETTIQKVASQHSAQGGMGGMGGMGGGEPVVLWFDPAAPTQFFQRQQLPALRNMFATVNIVRSREEEVDKGWPILASAYGGWGMGGGMMGGMGSQGGGFFNVANQVATTGAPGRDSISFLAFEPKPGQVNEWKIQLPEFTLDRVRIKLKMKPDPAAAEPAAGDDTEN
jgi:hypothetical protein